MTVKTYSLSKRRQLADLNGTTTNFDLTFTVTCKKGGDFDVLVVDQHTLDNNPNLKYKHAVGSISGNIIADSNKYQNYFLIMKADKPCDVEVKISKKDIPPKAVKPSVPMKNIPPRAPSLQPPQQPGRTNWKLILIVIIIIGGGVLLYYFYTHKKGKAVEGSVEPTVGSPEKQPTKSPPPATSSFGNQKLLERLNNFPFPSN